MRKSIFVVFHTVLNINLASYIILFLYCHVFVKRNNAGRNNSSYHRAELVQYHLFTNILRLFSCDEHSATIPLCTNILRLFRYVRIHSADLCSQDEEIIKRPIKNYLLFMYSVVLHTSLCFQCV